jgi:hypothetical protein
MTGPELDLLEGGGGHDPLRDHENGLVRLGGRVVLAAECENGHSRYGQRPSGSADYVSTLAVRAQARARGHRFVGGATYQRRYDLGGIRIRRRQP